MGLIVEHTGFGIWVAYWHSNAMLFGIGDDPSAARMDLFERYSSRSSYALRLG